MSAPYRAMLAQEIGSLDGLELSRYVAEQKCDGWFVEIHRHGDQVELWSRRQKALEGRGAEWLRSLDWPDDTVVIGELYVPGGSSHDVTHELANGGERFRYAIFDVLRAAGADLLAVPLVQRMMERGAVVRYVQDPRVHEVAWTIDGWPSTIQAFCEQALAQGEGAILKEKASPYRPGQRLRDWLKFKKVNSIDVVITDADSKPSRWRVRPGQKGTDGKMYPEGLETDPWRSGWAGLSYGFWDPAQGKAVRVGSLGITGPKDQLEQHVGKVAEVRCWGVYPGGRLRHPQHQRWRDAEKAQEDCLKPEVR